jgi:predicted nucleic acid-binding protein
VNPEGPFLFDTSAESWLSRDPAGRQWLLQYSRRHLVYVSAITVMERLTGFGIALAQATPERAGWIRSMRDSYDQTPARVLPVHHAVARAAAELICLAPDAPSPPVSAHRRAESRAGRVARWRFDVLIAATSLVQGLPLVHNNARDFEALREALARRPERFPGLSAMPLLRCTDLHG